MSATGESFSFYSLLVGDWNPHIVESNVPLLPEVELALLQTIGSRLGLALDLAFPAGDPRREIIIAGMNIGVAEFVQRGYDPSNVKMDMLWDRWCAMMETNHPDAVTVPTRQITEIRDYMEAALPHLNGFGDAAEAREAMSRGIKAINALLQARGQGGGTNFQA